MGVFSTGGGGGKAANLDTVDTYALGKPYSVEGNKFTAEMAQRIDEMFDILFKNVTRAKEDIDVLSLEPESDDGWTYQFLTVEVSVADNTLTTVSELTFDAPSTVRRIAEARLFFSFGSADDMQIRHQRTNFTDGIYSCAIQELGTNGVTMTGVGLDTASATHTISTAIAGSARAYVRLYWDMYNVFSGGGTISIRVAKSTNTSGETLFVRAGSYVRYRDLGNLPPES